MRSCLSGLHRGGYGALRATRKAVLGAGLALAVPAVAVADETVIAALGDSLTQGYGLPQGDGLVPQLQDWLDAQGLDVRLVNAGVSGDTTAGGLSRVDWTLTPEVDGMMVALGGNDLLRGIDPAVSRENLDGILQAAGNAGVAVLLVGLSAPGNYGPDYKRAFEAIFPDLAAKHDTLLVEDLLAPLRSGDDDARAAARFMQADGIHPDAGGVARIVEALGPKVAALAERAGP